MNNLTDHFNDDQPLKFKVHNSLVCEIPAVAKFLFQRAENFAFRLNFGSHHSCPSIWLIHLSHFSHTMLFAAGLPSAFNKSRPIKTPAKVTLIVSKILVPSHSSQSLLGLIKILLSLIKFD